MRNLATIQRIKSIESIPEADNIELVRFLDVEWQVVVEKDKYKADDLVVVCEIDSFIPNSIAPFLTKSDKEPKEYNGVKGERLRTVKLKNTLSQGLVLENKLNAKLGEDVTEKLGIIKWESDSDQQQNAIETKQSKLFKKLMSYYIFRNTIGKILKTFYHKPKGNFPSFIVKTDEERIQNFTKEFNDWKNTIGWSITEKLDGQSGTYYSSKSKWFGRDFGVCSRNMWLKTPSDSNWWKIAEKYDIKNKLKKVKYPVYIQGEIIGKSIQGNPYKINDLRFYVFNVFNLETKEKMSNYQVSVFCQAYGFEMVPFVQEHFTMTNTIDELLKLADGKSLINKNVDREGLVIRRGNISFKAISNNFLLKQK